jgi:hypothetical protein
MPPARRLHLPIADTAEEAEDAFRKMCQAMVIELGQRFDTVGQNQIGADWVEHIVATGHSGDEVKDWHSPFDPSFVFGEPIKYPNSIVWRALPRNLRTKDLLKSCRWARNRWEHQRQAPTLAQLKQDMRPFAELAFDAGLELRLALPALLERINAVLTGSFDAQVETIEETIAVGIDEIPAEAQAEVEKDDLEHLARQAQREEDARQYPRPRVGGAWVGPRPDKALQFRRQLNDLVDLKSNTSVKSKWGDDAKLQISRLKLIDPMGDLFLDESDGALFGYKYGTGFLLGYLGKEPVRDPSDVQGFALPHSFYMENGDLFQFDTNVSLRSLLGDSAATLLAVLNKAVNELDEIKITTHGDLFSITEDGIVKIARVEAKDWFPGQLPA